MSRSRSRLSSMSRLGGVVKTLMIMNGSYVGITKIHHYPHFIINNIPLGIVFIA